MQEDQTPIKIEILEEEKPFVAEEAQPDGKEKVKAVGQQVSETAVAAAQKAWQSDARKKVTGTIRQGAAKGVHAVQDKVAQTAEEQARAQTAALQNKLRETDWKHEAQTGAARGLRWLSQQLANLSQRFAPAEKSPPSDNE